MTDKTPATEAGRRLVDTIAGGNLEWRLQANGDVLAIEAEARADGMMQGMGASYQEGRADARKEAADAVRALPDTYYDSWRAAVLAILAEQKP